VQKEGTKRWVNCSNGSIMYFIPVFMLYQLAFIEGRGGKVSSLDRSTARAELRCALGHPEAFWKLSLEGTKTTRVELEVGDKTFAWCFYASKANKGALIFDPLPLLRYVHGTKMKKASDKFRSWPEAHKEQYGLGGKLYTTWSGFLLVLLAARRNPDAGVQARRDGLIKQIFALEAARGFGLPVSIRPHCKHLTPHCKHLSHNGHTRIYITSTHSIVCLIYNTYDCNVGFVQVLLV